MTETAATTYETIRAGLAEEGTVLELVLDRPKGNVLTGRMMDELSRALAEHRDRRDLRLVVLRGAGEHFSFGASVEEHRKDQAPAMLATFHRLIRELAGYPVPVAALAEGQCLGGGFEVVLVCHFLFATPTARFGCPEIKLGVFPPVLAAIGARRFGAPTAERMLLTGESLDASQAWRSGFITGVFEDGDPREALLAWYRETLRPLSAFALRQGTKALRQATGFLDELDRTLQATEDQYVREVLESHDGNEGIEAFLERRKPAWQDA
ncbi:MAG: enoyl-CoA hydratase/isomerase family protein [Thermoanaerobaculia bacterium]